MSENEYTAIINGLIALCQNYDILPTNGNELADELQSIAANQCYISKSTIADFL